VRSLRGEFDGTERQVVMMTTLRVPILLLVAGLTLGSARPALATPFDLTIGDNDGFGFGAAAVPDGSPLLNNVEANINLAMADRRSAAEKLATNGAQQTDVYTAVDNYPGFLSSPEAFDVIFPFAGVLTAATWTVDMGGVESDLYGPLTVSFNGVIQPGLFDFRDGQFGTAVRSFTLDAGALASANLAQQFVVNIARGSSVDAVAFDYFRLDGDLSQPAMPEPATMLTLGTGLAALVARRRRRVAA
jgi:hypothetical protein